MSGSQELMIIVQRRAHQTMPTHATTDSVKPTDLLRNGSSNNKITLATARLRTPAARLPDPSAANATSPIAAARSTLGSVRHKATKMITPASPRRRKFHPRRPIHRATVSRNANNSVRFAPDTAVRWVTMREGHVWSATSPASQAEPDEDPTGDLEAAERVGDPGVGTSGAVGGPLGALSGGALPPSDQSGAEPGCV